MRTTIARIVGVAAVAAFLGGCAGARGALAFDRLRYPVSASPFVFGPDDRPLNPGQLMPVGRMVWHEHIWGFWWSWIPLSGTVDVSDPINAQIARAGGDGIINLHVTVENCGMNYVPFLNWLPIYPGCTSVLIAGDIVRLPPMEAPPAAAPPPPPAAFIPKDKARQAISARMARLLGEGARGGT
jgi:hypothetical protein